jgi:hypothetical protein
MSDLDNNKDNLNDDLDNNNDNLNDNNDSDDKIGSDGSDSKAFFQLDDLVVAPDQLESSKVFQKAVIKQDFEIIIPKDEKEILIRDLKSSPFSRMADNLVNFYVEIDPKIDYLAQNVIMNQYLKENKFTLPWLVPIVKDEKLIYKKKMIDPQESNFYTEITDLMAAQAKFSEYANVGTTQVMVENLHNYRTVQSRVNMINHSGSHVLRLTKNMIENNSNTGNKTNDGTSDNEITYNDVQFRGSYGDWQLVQIKERAKTSRKTVIVGFERVDKVIGERLQVVGFARLPLSYPDLKLLNKLPDLIDISINRKLLRPEQQKISVDTGLEGILRTYLPDVGAILQNMNLNGVTDFTLLLDIFKRYGHSPQSLTQANRKAITSLIMTNIENMPVQTYTPTDRLSYPELERELIKAGIDSAGGILGSNVLEHPVMIKYGLKFEQFPHIYHRYLRIINRLDNGNVWTTLINPISTMDDIKRAAHHYQVIRQNREIALDLEASYSNLNRKTMENQALYQHLLDGNPLDNILEVSTEKRDRISWYQYFKVGYPDRFGKNILFHGKYIGCQHEYDRLYQMFEDPNDDYPQGKVYTRMIPNDGIVCAYCGDTLEDQDEITTQGYDSSGQRITTFAGNDGLLKETSNIDVFFKRNKSEIVRHGEKLVDQWLDMSNKRLRTKAIKAIKYKLLRPFEEAIISNQYFYGLQQNPNKLVKAKQDRPFGEWFLSTFNIQDARKPINYLFVQKIFAFYYSISSIYEIVIQRLAVFMVFLNWHLADEDPIYLNSNNLLSYWSNPEQLAQVFLDYNISEKSAWLSLKPGSKGNPFYDEFMEKALDTTSGGGFIPKGSMTSQMYESKIREEFLVLRRRFLYTSGVQGDVWNGFNSFEHEMIMIWSRFQESIGKPSIMEYLNQSFTKYWKQWLNLNPIEAKSMEENAKINLIPQRGVLSDATPKSIRPLYDRYLAQHKFILNRKLEDVYIGLINENIYNIRSNIQESTTEPVVTGQEQVILRKMFLLDKISCDYWKNLDDLNMGGFEEDTVRIKLITDYKEEVSVIESQMNATSPLFAWQITGGFIVRDLRERVYEYGRYVYQPPNMVAENPKLKYQSIVIRMPSKRAEISVDEKDLPAMSQLMVKDLSFINQNGKDDDNSKSNKSKEIDVEKFGLINWIPDLIIWEKNSYEVDNGLRNGVASCQDTNPNRKRDQFGGQYGEFRMQFEYISMKDEEFQKLFSEMANDDFGKMPYKMQLLNMKKYLITVMRHHIQLMSRISTRGQMLQYGLERYVHLFEQSDFNDAFQNFNLEEDDQLGRIFSIDEIEDMVQNGLKENIKRQKEIIKQLQTIFICDLVRQLRNVRIKAGKFTKSTKNNKNNKNNENNKGSSKKTNNLADDGKKESNMDAGQIFQEFIRCLMNEIRDDTAVNNVDFNHKEINQTFQSRTLWHKMDNAEKKSELDQMISKRNLVYEEMAEAAVAEGVSGEKASGTEPTEDGLDELDHENDEDDYDDTLDN